MGSGGGFSKSEFVELLMLALEGLIDEEKFELLQQQIVSNPEAEDIYYEFLSTHVGLSHYGKFASSSLNRAEPESDFDVLLALLADNEKTAPTVKIDKPEVSEPKSDVEVVKEKRQVSKLSLFTLILSCAAMLLIICIVIFKPVRPIVANLTDSINAEWGESLEKFNEGHVFREGSLVLTSGLAEITFDGGAVVIVEGPAEIELLSSGSMFVSSGKINAYVSSYALGFTVKTSSANIVDLGTEFGINVKPDGSCDVHMFQGKANLITGKQDEKKISQIVCVNDARSVDGVTGQISNISFEDKTFARYFDSQTSLVWRGEDFDLADVVGGGDGFGSGELGYGINLDTARVATQRYISFLRKPGPFYAKPVSSLPFVECLFVPDGGSGDVAVSTCGIIFADCPDTDGNSWGDVLNGGVMLHGPEPERQLDIVLDGHVYGTADRPAIYMHGNLGVTFDLKEIRAAMPGVKVKSLSTLCGISQTVVDDPNYERDPGKFPIANMWVLVDGQERFSTGDIKVGSKPVKVDVDLNDNDRFLTFVVTDSGDGNSYDWGIFAEPLLRLEQRSD